MKVTLAYGKSGLEVDLPEQGVKVIEPRFVEGLADEAASLLQALRHPVASAPLRELATAESSVAIIFPDRTRAMPSDRVLPIVLSELDQVPKENITLINAVGTHRSNTPQELEAMLGREILSNYRIVQHQPRERSSMVHLGASRFGNQVWINNDFVQARLKILTGFIEPHLFAGFREDPRRYCWEWGASRASSGTTRHQCSMTPTPPGGNRQQSHLPGDVRNRSPGRAGLHRQRHPQQEPGNYRCLRRRLEGSHAQGCRFARESVMQPVEEPFDVVVTTNSGFPLDPESLPGRQGHVGSLPHRQAGGTIIMASECCDGVPAEGNFGRLLRSGDSPAQLLSNIRNHTETIQDQWQVQILAKILMKSEVYLYSTLPDSEVLAAHLKPVQDIAGLVRRLQAALGPSCRIAVLPEGPQTVPYVSGKVLSRA